jgi:hypothetical protein
MVAVPLVVLPAAVGTVGMLLRRIAPRRIARRNDWAIGYLFPDYRAMLNREGAGKSLSSGGSTRSVRSGGRSTIIG